MGILELGGQVQILAMPFVGCVTLGKLLNISVLAGPSEKLS